MWTLVIKVRRWPCYLTYLPVTYCCLSHHDPKTCIKQPPFYSHTLLGWEFREETVGMVCSTMSGFSDGKTRIAGYDLIRGSWNNWGWRIHFQDDFFTHVVPGLRWLEGWAQLGQLTRGTTCPVQVAGAFHSLLASGDWVLRRRKKAARLLLM